MGINSRFKRRHKIDLISGKFNSDKTNLLTDSWALDNNFISVVPVSLYPHSSEMLSKLKFLENVF